MSVASKLGTSDVLVQRQEDWLVSEKHELRGWDPDQEDLEAEEIILEIYNVGKCRKGNFGQFICHCASHVRFPVHNLKSLPRRPVPGIIRRTAVPFLRLSLSACSL